MCAVTVGSLAVRVGVVNEKEGKNLFLNKKVSVAALRGNDCSLWLFEDGSTVINACPPCSVSCAACF